MKSNYCPRYDKCWFVKIYKKSEPFFKHDSKSWMYEKNCISNNQDECPYANMSDIEFKIFEREVKTSFKDIKK
jgi:hypothetical protein